MKRNEIIAHRSLWFAICGVLIALAVTSADEPLPPTVDFNRDVRPILSDHCFVCHGPDREHREADLRLDTRDDAFADRDGSPALVAGNLGKSELYARITSDDPDTRMPPPEAKRTLSSRQVALIRKWIEQGANWQQHWSFVVPHRPSLPQVSNVDWCRNPIDHFVLARLDHAGFKPSPTADKATLIRRATLDLTGLPPTPAEVDAFLADDSPRAYERVIDRLLASPRYGERMAARWLDLARYADTSGYQNDGPRSMWRWRDWVIDAYNNNLPFDQFTIEQLAGDLMQETPPPGRDGSGALALNEDALNRLIATGFNRNHRGNAEGGIVPEEFQVEYVVDRVDTTATVWLGLTMGCARCHDHKYDPISQEDFYGVFSYFNNVPEFGRAIKEGNSPPYVKAPTRKQRQELRRLEQAYEDMRSKWQQSQDALQTAQVKWEARFVNSKPARDWTIDEGLVARFALDGPAGKVHESGEDPLKFRAGRIGKCVQFDGETQFVAGNVARFGYFDKFSLSAWIKADGDGTIVSRMTPEQRADGYYVDLIDRRVQVNLVKRWLDDSIRVESVNKIDLGTWHHIAVTYDGSRMASGISIYIDGQPSELNVHHDFLNQTMANDEPLRIGAGNGNFRGSIDEVRVYDRCLEEPNVQVLAAAESIDQIVAIPADKRNLSQSQKLRAFFLAEAAPASIRKSHSNLAGSRAKLQRYVEQLPTVMIMSDDQPRETHVLHRGQYNQPKKSVTASVPAFLPPLPEGAANNRLGFAQWLVSEEHPLTARVAVNRYWQMFFGEGLVRSMEDFGSQGHPPTHPQLLDWLATEFVREGWDVKHLQKTIVMSATYRQSSRGSTERFEQDPENRLLARGPRFRLSAEVIRDQALAASGLLHEQIGGPSVKPYQPTNLWKEIATDTIYEQSTGNDLYRRSLYTYWKRTVAPPTMTTFDATPREMCTVRRARTNTPLQALALMNDVTYVEAARRLAQRMILEGGDTPHGRTTRGFRLVLGRPPKKQESVILLNAYQRYRKQMADRPLQATELIAIGESEPVGDLDPVELAAYTLVASVILNLDETVTRI